MLFQFYQEVLERLVTKKMLFVLCGFDVNNAAYEKDYEKTYHLPPFPQDITSVDPSNEETMFLDNIKC